MTKREGVGKVWTVPNALTLLRFLLVGVMAWLFVEDQPIWSMAVYLLAAGTDLLDGYIARRFNQISNIGKVMDPIADKLMTVTALVCMLVMGYLTFGLLLVIVIKEALMVLGGVLIYFVFGKVVYANLFGKISSAAYFFAIMLMYLHKYVMPYDAWFMYLAVAMNVVSMVQYGVINIVMEARKKKKEAA
jgi:CDP-diacylglycerol--glycerol-3-phosphate 3-phosphatidyltransferase